MKNAKKIDLRWSGEDVCEISSNVSYRKIYRINETLFSLNTLHQDHNIWLQGFKGKVYFH